MCHSPIAVPEPPTERTDDDHVTEAERRRLYNLGALAQSYPPRGVADLLKRPESQPPWRERPVRERAGLLAVLVVDALLAGIVIAGIATRSVALVLAGAVAFLLVILATAAATIWAETRRARSSGPRSADHKSQ
jgi:hypothetical protein